MVKNLVNSLMVLVVVALGGAVFADGPEARVVTQPAATAREGLYTPNRAPLAPTVFVKLPLGSVAPRGWLRRQMELDAGGIPGRFEEISKFLKFDECGWARPDKHGWEELPYWLRGYVALAYTLKDEKLIGNARRWIEAILATRQGDGFFGPANLRCVEKGKAESFPHMCVVYPLCSYYEATGDQRALDAISGFYRWLSRQPEMYFKSGWGAARWSEHLLGIYWTYNRTGERELLDLAKRIHEVTSNWTTGIPTAHNVNFSQGFREPAEFWLQSQDRKLLDAVEEHYRQIMETHGQFPGGGFAGDEGRRPGYVDPRQGFETCGFIESMLSDEILTRITGAPAWADRCEEIAFNSLPAALTPDHRALHYITSANSIQLDKTGKKLAQFGNHEFPMQAYEPSPHGYRCCPHNYGMAWPFFTESLWLATADRGLCASLYCACEVKAKVADGTEVSIAEESDYPFDGTITLRIGTGKAAAFPLWLRVPRWCDGAAVKVNGGAVNVSASPQSYIVLERQWKDGDVVTLQLPMRVAVRQWRRYRNAVSVDYGPLTFSLDIKERWTAYQPEKVPAWLGSEVFADSPWNYGLLPEQTFEIVRKPGPLAADPFTHEGAPIALRAQARKIPGWQADDNGVVGPLQQSPAKTTSPVENVTLIPMGAARLRITSFPTVTTASDGYEWHAPPRCVTQVTSSYDDRFWSPLALFYGIDPANSRDETVPYFAWWNHLGTREWVRYRFPRAIRVSAVAVYWHDDQGARDWYAGSGAMAAPQSWSVQYYDGNTWKPVTAGGDYGTARDCYNRVEFTPVVTTSVRLAVQLQPRKCAGLYGWRVFDGQTQLVPTSGAAAEQAVAAGVEMPLPHGELVPESWFKPEMLKETKDGQPVVGWTDDAIGANDARAISPGGAPTVAHGAINGRSVLHFEAEKNQSLTFPRTIEDDFTIAVVFRSRHGSGSARHFGLGSPVIQGDVPGDKEDFGISLDAKGHVLAGTGKPDTTIASAAGFDDGKAHFAVFTRVKATGEIRLFMDGKQAAIGKGGTQSLTAPSRIAIGADPINRNHFTGDIGEVVIYAHALNDAQRTSLEERLLTRWGIDVARYGTPASAPAMPAQ